MFWCLNNKIDTKTYNKNWRMYNVKANNNYITRIQDSSATYHIYHNKMIFFGGLQLSKVIVPGLCYQLKQRIKYLTILNDIQCTVSDYDLESNLSADKLTEDICSVLSSSLLLIHTWFVEHSTSLPFHSSYLSFFLSSFDHILLSESNPIILDLTSSLKLDIKRIGEYLGTYNGVFEENIFDTQLIIAGILSMFCADAVLSGKV